MLLQLASEDGHALQEPAAEAIGHLRRSPQAEKIFQLLERLAKGTGGVAQRALVGLRWFDTPSRLAAHPPAGDRPAELARPRRPRSSNSGTTTTRPPATCC